LAPMGAIYPASRDCAPSTASIMRRIIPRQAP